MPRNTIGKSPFPVQIIDCDEPLTLPQITSALKQNSGVSLCIRTRDGHKNRGGYFFHIQRTATEYKIIDFEKNKIATLDSKQLVCFANHVSGRKFDPEMLVFCQSIVNFRQDGNEHDQEV